MEKNWKFYKQFAKKKQIIEANNIFRCYLHFMFSISDFILTN